MGTNAAPKESPTPPLGALISAISSIGARNTAMLADFTKNDPRLLFGFKKLPERGGRRA